jgi:hypothetical protein
MEVWVVFVGGFLEVDMCSTWTWDFYGIYNSEEKAKEVIASLEAELDDDDETEYKVEKHSVQ